MGQLTGAQILELLTAPVFWLPKGCEIWKLATGFEQIELNPPKQLGDYYQYFELWVHIGEKFYTAEQLLLGSFHTTIKFFQQIELVSLNF